MKKGVDFPGIGVGALIFDGQGRILLMRRGPEVRNEAGYWDMPGGGVRLGEARSAAILREVREELGLKSGIVAELLSFDHFPQGQHWVTTPFLVRVEKGEPRIMEPGKCAEIRWFPVKQLPRPLTESTRRSLQIFRQRQATLR